MSKWAWIAWLAFMASARGEEPAELLARAHYEQGVRLYDGQRYREAATEFAEAHRAEPRPAFDYNRARALSRAGDLDGAIEAYGRYADSDPPPDDVDEVRQRIEAMRARLIARQRLSLASYVTASAGGLVLLGSVASGIASHVIYSGLVQRCSAGCVPSDQGTIDTGHGTALASDVLLGIGVTVVAVAVVVYAIERVHR